MTIEDIEIVRRFNNGATIGQLTNTVAGIYRIGKREALARVERIIYQDSIMRRDLQRGTKEKTAAS